MDTLLRLNQYKNQYQPAIPAQKTNQASSTKTTTGHTAELLQTDVQSYMSLLTHNESDKKISDFSIKTHPPKNPEYTAITLHDDDHIKNLLQEIENREIDIYPPINDLRPKTPGDYYSFIEKALSELESIANREKGGSLSCVKKTVYGVILFLSATGASSALLGVMPLGAEATTTDRAIGISQFVLSFFFAQGVSHTNSMYQLIRAVDRLLTRCFRCGADSSIGSRFRDWLSKTSPVDLGLLVVALGVAAYAPMQSAYNSRNGVINLITGGSQDPLRKKIGEVMGNILMTLNWTAGSSLALMMASSLFDGYKKDVKTLWNGASAEQINIARQIQFIRKWLISDHFNDADTSLTNERLVLLADPAISESFLFALELLKAQSREGGPELPTKLQNLLKDLGLDTPEKQQQAITELEKSLDTNNARQTDSRAQLISLLSHALESPILSKTALAKFDNDSVIYSSCTARTQALLRLMIRITTNWLALNCLALTLVTPGVVNHYKANMDDPSEPVDCQALQTQFNSTGIEPYDQFRFELGLGAYMAKGLSLSNFNG